MPKRVIKPMEGLRFSAHVAAALLLAAVVFGVPLYGGWGIFMPMWFLAAFSVFFSLGLVE